MMPDVLLDEGRDEIVTVIVTVGINHKMVLVHGPGCGFEVFRQELLFQKFILSPLMNQKPCGMPMAAL